MIRFPHLLELASRRHAFGRQAEIRHISCQDNMIRRLRRDIGKQSREWAPCVNAFALPVPGEFGEEAFQASILHRHRFRRGRQMQIGQVGKAELHWVR